MTKLEKLEQMLKNDSIYMLTDLMDIKDQLDSEITDIDVRLCIDFDSQNEPNWIIRSGDSSYDQRHSELCGADSVQNGCTVRSILAELVGQVLDQCAELESIENSELTK